MFNINDKVRIISEIPELKNKTGTILEKITNYKNCINFYLVLLDEHNTIKSKAIQISDAFLQKV